ncbi:variant SH3 domain-containing protein [Loa loa]|uniref:Osteoclast-stimulating factor 1 n=1 Tax=Loa loa TaxID=7209 RepID=A0A1I7W5P2_LOALO|nr:variant SH3 domain-containing protein [Loa loa]EFO22164.1 variant SH3 domain-containing protein [Loa loa]
MTESKPPRPAPKPGRVTVYRALYDYTAQNDKELSFNEGDLLYVSDSSNDSQWWPARCRNQTGLIPANYVMTAEYIECPLHDAAKRGNIEGVKECLDNAVSVNGLDKSGSTPLYWSSHGGHVAIVKLLCSIPNMCISAQNKIGDTALHAAAWKGHLECVRILLEHGASTIIHNNDRKLPVDLASDPETRALIQLSMRQAIDTNDFRNEYSSESESETDGI